MCVCHSAIHQSSFQKKSLMIPNDSQVHVNVSWMNRVAKRNDEGKKLSEDDQMMMMI